MYMYDTREHTSTTGFPRESIGTRGTMKQNVSRFAGFSGVCMVLAGTTTFWLGWYFGLIAALSVAPAALMAHSIISVYKRAPMLLTLHLSVKDIVRYTFTVFPLLTLVGVGGACAVGIIGWFVMSMGYGINNGLTMATTALGALTTLLCIGGFAGIPISLFVLRKYKRTRDDFDCSPLLTTDFIRNANIHKN